MKHVFSFLIWMVIGQLVKLYSCFKSSNCSNSNYHFSDQVSWSQTGWEERLLLGQKRSVWESKGAVQHFRVPHQDGAGGAGWPCQDTFLKLNLTSRWTWEALREGCYRRETQPREGGFREEEGGSPLSQMSWIGRFFFFIKQIDHQMKIWIPGILTILCQTG